MVLQHPLNGHHEEVTQAEAAIVGSLGTFLKDRQQNRVAANSLFPPSVQTHGEGKVAGLHPLAAAIHSTEDLNSTSETLLLAWGEAMVVGLITSSAELLQVLEQGNQA